MSEFFTPYEGKRPYLFISYSHRNSREVLETITLLHQRRVRLWYDEGIPAGNDWPKNIETHMRCSAMVLFFLSKTALSSPNCLSEIETAVELGKPVLCFTLDDSQPEGRWAELMKNCLPLPTPSDANARADAVTGHRLLRRTFYRRWTERLPRGLFGFLLSLLLFGTALVGGYGLYAGWFDRIITEVTAPAPTPRPTAAPSPAPTPTPSPTPTSTSEATATPAPTPSFPSDVYRVKFPDEQQQTAVLAMLGRSRDKNRDVELPELAAVTELYMAGNLSKADIVHTAFDHQGACLVNGVPVPEGMVKDLSVIGRMAYLEKLALVLQPLSNVSALNGLVMLNELYLSGDRSLKSLQSLTYLPRLQTLHLEHSGVKDLSSLLSLPSLQTVTVSADMLPLGMPDGAPFTVVLVP